MCRPCNTRHAHPAPDPTPPHPPPTHPNPHCARLRPSQPPTRIAACTPTTCAAWPPHRACTRTLCQRSWTWTTRPPAASLWPALTTAQVGLWPVASTECSAGIVPRLCQLAAQAGRRRGGAWAARQQGERADSAAGAPRPSAASRPHAAPQCASSRSTAATRATCTTQSACSACLRCASAAMAPTSSQVGAAPGRRPTGRPRCAMMPRGAAPADLSLIPSKHRCHRLVRPCRRAPKPPCLASTTSTAPPLAALPPLPGSDDMNVRVWKAEASEQMGTLLPRERKKHAYNKALVRAAPSPSHAAAVWGRARAAGIRLDPRFCSAGSALDASPRWLGELARQVRRATSRRQRSLPHGETCLSACALRLLRPPPQVERHKHLPEVARIVRHRHLPAPIYKAAKLRRTQIDAERRKTQHRIAHRSVRAGRAPMPGRPFFCRALSKARTTCACAHHVCLRDVHAMCMYPRAGKCGLHGGVAGRCLRCANGRVPLHPLAAAPPDQSRSSRHARRRSWRSWSDARLPHGRAQARAAIAPLQLLRFASSAACLFSAAPSSPCALRPLLLYSIQLVQSLTPWPQTWSMYKGWVAPPRRAACCRAGGDRRKLVPAFSSNAWNALGAIIQSLCPRPVGSADMVRCNLRRATRTSAACTARPMRSFCTVHWMHRCQAHRSQLLDCCPERRRRWPTVLLCAVTVRGDVGPAHTGRPHAGAHTHRGRLVADAGGASRPISTSRRRRCRLTYCASCWARFSGMSVRMPTCCCGRWPPSCGSARPGARRR